MITELASHPDVLEVSVVGREHPTWGERPMAYVILYAEAARRWAGKHAAFSSALKAHARERLPGFATPEWVVIVEELPVCPLVARVHEAVQNVALRTRKRRPERL
jgi:acyl-CoA synthetase (AMP-forming)/AMP-acid ligase II